MVHLLMRASHDNRHFRDVFRHAFTTVLVIACLALGTRFTFAFSSYTGCSVGADGTVYAWAVTDVTSFYPWMTHDASVTVNLSSPNGRQDGNLGSSTDWTRADCLLSFDVNDQGTFWVSAYHYGYCWAGMGVIMDTSSSNYTNACAVPTNYELWSCGDFGAGTLICFYGWGSSIGNVGNLARCSMGETVSYSPSDVPFPPPFPPVDPDNPTIILFPADGGSGMDTHSTDGTFVKPYFRKAFAAGQTYWYSCACKNGGSPQTLMGPHYIVRSVETNGQGGWRFTCTKHGVSATIDPLP